MGMPRIEIEFEFDMVFCFGIRLAPYTVFATQIYLQHIARPLLGIPDVQNNLFRHSSHLISVR